MSECQNQRILEYLKSGRSLTQKEAIERFGCYRLSGRIYDLRKDHTIDNVMEANGNGGQHARYFIKSLCPIGFRSEENGQLVMA